MGQSREIPGGPDAFACGAVPEVWTPLRASFLDPEFVTSGVSLPSSQQTTAPESLPLGHLGPQTKSLLSNGPGRLERKMKKG